MIRDLEDHRITCAEGMNPHVMITGASGGGKTTAAVCLMNEIVNDRDRKVLVIDQSNSYTAEQMKEHGAGGPYESLDPCHGPVYLATAAGAVGADRIVAALAEAADIRSYHQRAALKTACRAVMEDEGNIAFPRLIKELDMEYYRRRDSHEADRAKAAEQLLDRLSPLEELDALRIGPEEAEDKPPVTVLQLSGVSPMARDILVRFCLALLWEEMRQSGERPPYDVVLLDELQSIPLTADSSLWSMLREARKFKVRLILCTQSLGIYGEEQLAMLTQAGHQFFFRPPTVDLPLVDKLLGGGWRDTLSDLRRGQAVLMGSYHLDERRQTASTPLEVRFQQDG